VLHAPALLTRIRAVDVAEQLLHVLADVGGDADDLADLLGRGD